MTDSSFLIAAPVERVFALMTDFANAPGRVRGNAEDFSLGTDP
jgi:hypothetical protein